MVRIAYCRWFIRMLLFFTAGLAAFGQVAQTQLTGEMRDSSGAPVPGATVQLTEVETQQTQSVRTSSVGLYIFPYVKPGVYTIEVQVAGFKSVRREGIRIPVGERIRVDVELSIGNVEETLTVNSDAPLLRTESSALGQVMGNRAVVNLPLKTRDFIGLVALSSGVALPPGSAFPRINGGRPRFVQMIEIAASQAAVCCGGSK